MGRRACCPHLVGGKGAILLERELPALLGQRQEVRLGGTFLAELYERGCYQPMELAEAVSLGAELLLYA